MSTVPDIAPAQAWEELKSNPSTRLVDVRTQPEWTYVGIPDLAVTGNAIILLSWQVYPSNARNEAFAEQLAAQGVTPETPIYLLCRSGVRSKAAGEFLLQQGYPLCFNIQDGFEGPLDSSRHRGSAAGWKNAGLPWVQG